MKRACLVLLLLLAAGIAVAGCAAFIRNLKEANAPEYLWKRQKVFQYEVDGKVVPFDEDAALKALPKNYTGEPVVAYFGESVTTYPGIAFAGFTESLLPVDVTEAIPKEYAKHLDSLLEIHPAPSERFAVLKSKNGDWNREFFLALNESSQITLMVDGSTAHTIMILSMVRINRDEPLDNTRKYVYSIEDENGNVKEVPAYATRRNDVLFYGVESESASTPHVYAFKVPEGKHIYIVKFKYSDGGDILLKFFEAKFR